MLKNALNACGGDNADTIVAIHVVGVAQQTFRLVSCRLPWHGTPAARISPCGEGRATNSSLHIHTSPRIAVDCCGFAVCCTLDSGSVASTWEVTGGTYLGGSRQKKKDSLFCRAAAAAVPSELGTSTRWHRRRISSIPPTTSREETFTSARDRSSLATETLCHQRTSDH